MKKKATFFDNIIYEHFNQYEKKMKLFSQSDAMSKIDQKIYPWRGYII